MRYFLFILVYVFICSIVVYADTLSKVKKRGELVCGVSTGLPGFASANSKGEWMGLDVDYCRAVAAAIFGDAKKVKFTPLTSKERFAALQTGEIDILSRNTTWTFTRDTSLGLNFVGVIYYDGQGFLVKKSLGVKSAKELSSASVCLQAGTTTELNINDYFKSNNMNYKAITYDTSAQTKDGFEKGRCDVLTSDQSQLYAIKSTLKNPSKYKVLPEVISKEPLSPVVRQGDDVWFNIAKWSLYALFEAEEQGVSSKNIFSKIKSKNPAIRRLLGEEGRFGKNLGLDTKWSYHIIKQVGSYAEIFEKNVGINTPLSISRGYNALWRNGGLIYPIPMK